MKAKFWLCVGLMLLLTALVLGCVGEHSTPKRSFVVEYRGPIRIDHGGYLVWDKNKIETKYATLTFNGTGKLVIYNMTYTPHLVKFEILNNDVTYFTFKTDGQIVVYYSGSIEIAKGNNSVNFSALCLEPCPIEIKWWKNVFVPIKIHELVVTDYSGNVIIKQAGHVFVDANNVEELTVSWKNRTFVFNESGLYES